MAKNILIVEDELILAMINQQIIESAGHRVISTLTKGEEAVEYVKINKPDVIIMDIFLEGKQDGISAMEEIRKFSDVPVIYVTGNSDPKSKTRAKETNYKYFLIKPVDSVALQEALDMI